MRSRLAIIAGIVIVMVGVGLQPADPAHGQTPLRTVRIGVVNTLAPGIPATLIGMAMRPFRTYMEEKIGTSGEILRSGDAFQLAKQMQDDKVQVGIFHGHEFAWARKKHAGLKPVVVCINSMRSVRATLVVSAKLKAETCGDLEGKTLALPRDNRDHCRVFFEQRCGKPGVEASKLYARLARPADTEDALDDLVAGRVHAAVVDGVALERYRKAYPGRARAIRSLLTSEPFPPGVIAYYDGRFPAAEVKKLQEALVNAKSNERGKQTLQLLKLSSFEIAPADYDKELNAIAKSYPPPTK